MNQQTFHRFLAKVDGSIQDIICDGEKAFKLDGRRIGQQLDKTNVDIEYYCHAWRLLREADAIPWEPSDQTKLMKVLDRRTAHTKKIF